MMGEKYSVFKDEDEIYFDTGCKYNVVSISECDEIPGTSYTLIVL